VVIDRNEQRGEKASNAGMLASVVEFMDFARSHIGTEVTMEQVCVTRKGEFTRKTFGQLLELRKSGVIVFAIRKPGGDTTINPPPEFEVSAGDFLIVMGEGANLQRLERIYLRFRANLATDQLTASAGRGA
jgi:voltage-gated potassium channel